MPIAQAVISGLKQTFEEGYHADKVIERLLKSNRKWGARDRRFIAETTYEMVRWWRYLWFCSGEEVRLTESSLWRLLGTYLVLQKEELPTWREFKDLDRKSILQNAEKAKTQPAIAAALPDWLFERGFGELGETWTKILPALNEKAPVILRANRLKGTREELQKKLNEEEIETETLTAAPDGLRLKERKNVFQTEAFKAGLFEVQDGASQQVAPLLGVLPGQRVVDGCAGAGGKSLHLAALMKNKGKILALDVHERKLSELRKRATRAGADIIEIKVIDTNKVIKRMEKTADRVLLDVPCSGLGVLRRNPDTKWKLTSDELTRLNELQAYILGTYSEICKPGGRLVYATCSILPSENEHQVRKFLETYPDKWKLLEERKFLPGNDGFDGFYAAVLERVQ